MDSFYYFFSSLIATSRTSKTMLNNSGESGHPCLVPDLRGNAFGFSPLSIFFTVGLLYMAFIMLRQCRRCGFDSWVKNIPWRRKRQPTPVFLPGKSHGQRSLACYSPWGRKRVGHNLVTKRQQCSFCAYFLEGFYHNKHMKDAQHCSLFSSVQFSSGAQLCPTLCDPMNCSTPGLPVHHQLPEFTQTHVLNT